MLTGKKILIIAPHPDDESICSGGLIMLAKKQKAKIHILYISVGASRQFSTNQTTTEERLPEIQKAAMYGNYTFEISYEGKEFTRLDTVPQKDLIEKIEDAVQKFHPDIVIVPFHGSFNQDHRAVYLACVTAFRPLPKDLHHQPSIILECEEPYTWGTSQFTPNFYIDITTIMNEKIKLLACHKSQLRKDPFPRSPENIKRLAGLRGSEISVEYAEAYNLLREQYI